MAIDEAVARAHARDPGLGIADIDESGRGRHAHRMGGGWREFGSVDGDLRGAEVRGLDCATRAGASPRRARPMLLSAADYIGLL